MIAEISAAAREKVRRSVPMFFVPDMEATVAWYESIGFVAEDRFEDGAALVFARLSFGAAEFTLSPGGATGPRDVRFWILADDVQAFYRLFKDNVPQVHFEEELYEPFYKGRQFSIRDLNGLHLIFWQPEWRPSR